MATNNNGPSWGYMLNALLLVVGASDVEEAREQLVHFLKEVAYWGYQYELKEKKVNGEWCTDTFVDDIHNLSNLISAIKDNRVDSIQTVIDLGRGIID